MSSLRRPLSPVWVAAAAWIGRAISAATQLISVPLLLELLGGEDYAIFVVAMSLLGWFLLADAGIGSSLQNHISERRALGEPKHDFVVSAVVVLLPIGILSVLVAVAVAPMVAPLIWPNQVLAPAKVSALLGLSAGLFLATALGSVAYRIMFAEHRGQWANLLPAIASIFSIVGLYVVSNLKPADPLLWAMVAYNGPGVAISLGCLSIFFTRAWLSSGRPSIHHCRALLARGGQFLGFAFLSALTLQIDYLVLARYVDAKEIVVYNVATKVMGFVSYLYLAIVQALWPSCTEAAVRRDWMGVNQLMRRALLLGSLIVLAGSLVIWLLRDVIVAYLVPLTAISISGSLLMLLMIYSLLRVWSDTYAMLLQSMSRLKVFFLYVPVQAAISIAAQIALVNQIGAEGVVLGLILSFLLTAVWVLPREYLIARSEDCK